VRLSKETTPRLLSLATMLHKSQNVWNAAKQIEITMISKKNKNEVER
jgi:hypothetical protein